MTLYSSCTDRTKSILTSAQQTAKEYHHSYVGTGHLLVTLVRSTGGLGATTIKSFAEPATLLARVANMLPPPEEGIDHVTYYPFSPRAKDVLREIEADTQEYPAHVITSAHLLIGLLREGGGVAAQALTQAGLTVAAVRVRLAELLSAGLAD